MTTCQQRLLFLGLKGDSHAQILLYLLRIINFTYTPLDTFHLFYITQLCYPPYMRTDNIYCFKDIEE